jgi:putative NADH-flavin reductase
MKLLVLGAGGGTGRVLVAQAVALRHEVTAFGHRAGQDAQAGVRYVSGDVRDEHLVESLTGGQDAVLDALGTRRPWVRTTLETDASRLVIAAMRRDGVRRLLAVSSIGVGDSIANVNAFYRMLMPLFFRGVLPDKEGMEAEVRSSGLDWTIVRPAGLTNGPLTGSVEIVSPESGRSVRRISRADVAAFMLREVEVEAYVGRTVGIATS